MSGEKPTLKSWGEQIQEMREHQARRDRWAPRILAIKFFTFIILGLLLMIFWSDIRSHISAQLEQNRIQIEKQQAEDARKYEEYLLWRNEHPEEARKQDEERRRMEEARKKQQQADDSYWDSMMNSIYLP
jgi:hypothetical protein